MIPGAYSYNTPPVSIRKGDTLIVLFGYGQRTGSFAVPTLEWRCALSCYTVCYHAINITYLVPGMSYAMNHAMGYYTMSYGSSHAMRAMSYATSYTRCYELGYAMLYELGYELCYGMCGARSCILHGTFSFCHVLQLQHVACHHFAVGYAQGAKGSSLTVRLPKRREPCLSRDLNSRLTRRVVPHDHDTSATVVRRPELHPVRLHQLCRVCCKMVNSVPFFLFCCNGRMMLPGTYVFYVLGGCLQGRGWCGRLSRNEEK